MTGREGTPRFRLIWEASKEMFEQRLQKDPATQGFGRRAFQAAGKNDRPHTHVGRRMLSHPR